MTVAALPSIKSYNGNGVTTAFATNFQFLAADELTVRTRTASGVETVLVLGVGYNVTGGNGASGTVTSTVAPPLGTVIEIERSTARAQQTDYTANDRFPAETNERGLDRAMMIDQEQDDAIAETTTRALLVPKGEQAEDIPPAGQRAGRFLGFDAIGKPLALSGTGNDPALRTDLADPDAGGSLVAMKQPGPTAVTLDVSSEIRRIGFSPLQYGAVGDGIADDRQALQDASDQARLAGGMLIIPAGYVFGISSNVFVRDGVRGVMGNASGGGGTIKLLDSVVVQTSLVLESAERCDVTGITFDANGRPTLGIYLQNTINCRVTYNRVINHTGAGFGIFLKSFIASGRNAENNVIAYNDIEALPAGNVDTNHGIAVAAEIDFSPHGGSDTYWKATFTAKGPDFFPVNTQVIGNSVIGGYYGIDLLGAFFTEVSGNRCTNNTRNISVQSVSTGNQINKNVLRDAISSGVHLAYGSNYNTVSDNKIYTTRANGEGLLQNYVGCQYNRFLNNEVTVVAGAPQYFIYCAVKSDGVVFKNNVLIGAALRAFIGIESAWYGAVANPAHHAQGFGVLLDNFADNGMGNIEVTGNTIIGSSAVPAIFLSQITDGVDHSATGGHPLGVYRLENLTVNGNTVNGTVYSAQLEALEMTAGNLTFKALKDNAFDGAAPQAAFMLPRGRAACVSFGGNTGIDSNQAAYAFPVATATPSVAVGALFQLVNVGAFNITNFDLGTDGQEIVVRLDGFSTIKYGSGTIRPKGLVDIAPQSANAFVRFRRVGGIWFEQNRNF